MRIILESASLSKLPIDLASSIAFLLDLVFSGLVMSLKVIHFQSIFLINFYLKRLIYVQK